MLCYYILLEEVSEVKKKKQPSQRAKEIWKFRFTFEFSFEFIFFF